MTGRTGLLGRFALLLLGTLAGLGLGEILLRWLAPASWVYVHPRVDVIAVDAVEHEPQMAGPIFAAAMRYVDDGRGYRLKRNLRSRFRSSEFDVLLATNDQGLRGPDLPTDGTPRLLGLGDSFAMGFGVEAEETYLSVLADSLAARGRPVEPVNAGVVGYNLRNSYECLVGAAAGLHPEIVVLQIWTGDDLPAGGTVTLPSARGSESSALRLRMAVRRSHLAMLVRDRIRSIDAVRGPLMRRGYIQGFRAANLLRADLEQRWAAGLPATTELLAAFQAHCGARGTRLVAVLLPVKEQVDERYWQRSLRYNLTPVDPEMVDLDAPNRIARRLAAEADMELVDVLEPFRRAQRTTELFFDNDPHLTPAGHALVARLLADRLAPR